MLMSLLSLFALPLVVGLFRLSTSARNAAADGITALFNVGGAASLRVRTGAQPTNVADPDSGTLLGTLLHSATAFGAAAIGVATAAPITSDTSADASGTATQFRSYSGGGVCVVDGDAGMGSGTMNFDNNVIVAGGVIACTSYTITVPIS